MILLIILVIFLGGLFALFYFSATEKAKRALKHARKTLAANPTPKQLAAIAQDFKLPEKERLAAVDMMNDPHTLSGVLEAYLNQRKYPGEVAQRMLELALDDEYLPLLRRAFQYIQGNSYQKYAMDFAIRLAARYPSIIRENWRIIQTTAHADDSKAHTDTGDGAHQDFTALETPRGSFIPIAVHKDTRSPIPSSSDCTHYDHADKVSHKDVADPNGYLQRFPPAAVPKESGH